MPKPKESEKTQGEKLPKHAPVTEDSFAALVRSFKLSPKFTGCAETTRDTWGRALDFAARPNCLGAFSLQEIRPKIVQAFLDGFADMPGKQHVTRSVLRQLEKWAIVRDLIPREITTGVEITKLTGGHVPWTLGHVELGQRHARADIARAITLAANTGQRGSDLVRMCPTDIERFEGIDGINVVQQKTGKEVWIPITSTLATAMKTWERRPGPFLTNPEDQAWTRKALTNAWRYERNHNPELASHKALNLHLHGLRGHACVALKRAGANTLQIADIVGMSEEVVKVYTRKSSQRENAIAAVIHLEATIQERARGLSNKTG